MKKNIFYIFLLSSCITINKEDFNFTSKHNYVNAYDLSKTIDENKEDYTYHPIQVAKHKNFSQK